MSAATSYRKKTNYYINGNQLQFIKRLLNVSVNIFKKYILKNVNIFKKRKCFILNPNFVFISLYNTIVIQANTISIRNSSCFFSS